MGKTGRQLITGSIASFLLCLYLFEALAVNALHPLYHTHAHSCVYHVGDTHQAGEQAQALAQFSEASDNTNATVDQPCTFCHFSAQLKVIISTTSYKQVEAFTPLQYKEYHYNSHTYSCNTHQPSRAPPQLLA